RRGGRRPLVASIEFFSDFWRTSCGNGAWINGGQPGEMAMSAAANDFREIFCEALERQSPEDMAQYLDKVCADDTDLRWRIEDLLGAHQEAGNFLGGESSADATIPYVPLAEGPGSKIGRYKLLEQIGEGGFGVVFMAEQEEPVRRRAALKIIKLG